MQTVLYILIGILMFGVCVTVHEFGHYFAGRRLGLKVIEFAIGMGPKLISREKNGIIYSLRVLPIGGFCAFAGEDDDDEGEDSINNRPAWRRLVMTASGPIMNFVLAFLLAVVILGAIGEYQISNKIVSVTEGSPAAQAGLLLEDRIIGVNGRDGDIDQVRASLGATGSEDVALSIMRDGQRQEITVGKALNETGDGYIIGISFGYERQRLSFFAAIGNSFTLCADLLKEMMNLLGGMFFRGEGFNDVAGPVGIISTVTDIAQQSFAQSFLLGLDNMLRLTLLISLNLGLMNLLPLPALDGGRIVLLAFEAITKKHLPRKAEGIMNFVALILLMGLVLLITGRDILRLVGVM